MMTTHQDITFNSGGLALEGVLHLPRETGRFPGVVICHPHPRYGGSMDNVIVKWVARSLCEAGIAAFRFNYRGVGSSEGMFHRGIGEAKDAANALEFLSLQDSIDASRIGIAGYSFGAWMALEAAQGNSVVQAIASIACPARHLKEMGVKEMLQPKLLVCGEYDHDFPSSQFRFLSQRFSEPKQVEIIYGADHFFGGHVEEVSELVTGFFKHWLEKA
jgi:alpha/beta superfamily hydrolase